MRALALLIATSFAGPFTPSLSDVPTPKGEQVEEAAPAPEVMRPIDVAPDGCLTSPCRRV